LNHRNRPAACLSALVSSPGAVFPATNAITGEVIELEADSPPTAQDLKYIWAELRSLASRGQSPIDSKKRRSQQDYEDRQGVFAGEFCIINIQSPEVAVRHVARAECRAGFSCLPTPASTVCTGRTPTICAP